MEIVHKTLPFKIEKVRFCCWARYSETHSGMEITLVSLQIVLGAVKPLFGLPQTACKGTVKLLPRAFLSLGSLGVRRDGVSFIHCGFARGRKFRRFKCGDSVFFHVVRAGTRRADLYSLISMPSAAARTFG